MAYIERAYLTEQIEMLLHDDNIMNPVMKVLDALEIIDTAPTADVVEVVRCSQCKYWDNFKENYSRGNCTNEESGLFEFSLPNDYCSYGKRRDKDE